MARGSREGRRAEHEEDCCADRARRTPVRSGGELPLSTARELHPSNGGEGKQEGRRARGEYLWLSPAGTGGHVSAVPGGHVGARCLSRGGSAYIRPFPHGASSHAAVRDFESGS